MNENNLKKSSKTTPMGRVKRVVPFLALMAFVGLISGKLVWGTCPDDRPGARTGQPVAAAAATEVQGTRGSGATERATPQRNGTANGSDRR